MGYMSSNSENGSRGGKTLKVQEFEDILFSILNDKENQEIDWKGKKFGLQFRGKGNVDVYRFDGSERITICPEPLTFIHKFDDISDNKELCDEAFRKDIETFHTIELKEAPTLEGSWDHIWLNKTAAGINLRPGALGDDREDVTPIRMSDDNVHGIIVGRTGSGKSVYINALILSLITEYAPWELDLYLADFKKVELSRYMNDANKQNEYTAFTPQVMACAATSEIRYVLSMLRYLVDCMNARNEFFTRLGVTKIKEFREKYNLVLPRVLLIVDEFQQMYQESTTKEQAEINTLINSIAKLGRATGYHLIFASQEMSGTMGSNTLANFKIRMALPCNASISSTFLGNSAAAKLDRGYILVNTGTGKEIDNVSYRVPFAETDIKDAEDGNKKTEFCEYLDQIKLQSLKFDLQYKKEVQKFYREELQESEKKYREELDHIRAAKNACIRERKDSFFDAILLGRTVLYSIKKNDKQSLYLERGRNKGILIGSPVPEDIARIRKLIMENLVRSDDKIQHIALENNLMVYDWFRMDQMLEGNLKQTYKKMLEKDILPYYAAVYHFRKFAFQYKEENGKEFQDLRQRIHGAGVENSDKTAQKIEEAVKDEYKQMTDRIQEAEAQLKVLSTDFKARRERDQKFLKLCMARIDCLKEPGFGEQTEVKMGLERGRFVPNAKKYNEAYNKVLQSWKEESGVNNPKYVFRCMLYYMLEAAGVMEKSEAFTVEDDILKQLNSIYKETEDGKKFELEQKIAELKERKHNLLQQHGDLEKKEEENQDLQKFSDAFFKEFYKLYSRYYNTNFKSEKTPPPSISVIDGKIRLVYPKTEEKTFQKFDFERHFQDLFQMDKVEGSNFEKMVFWFNGLDEINKIPMDFSLVASDSINFNILTVGMITTAGVDALVKNSCDYGFATGNVEKLYSICGVKYTKQAPGSIAVSCGVKSKGFEIPFKMYKSELGKTEAPDFMEALL